MEIDENVVVDSFEGSRPPSASRMKGRERAIVNQKAKLGKLLRQGVAHMGFSERTDTILN